LNLRFAIPPALLLLWTFAALAAEDAKTNEQVYNELCSSAVEEILVASGTPRQGMITLKLHEGPATEYFRLILLGDISAAGRQMAERSAVNRPVLSIQVEQPLVAYHDRFGDGLFEKAKTQREIKFSIRAVFQDSVGMLRWSGTVQRNYCDTVAIADVERLEQTTSHLARGIVPERTLLERFIEPAIVIGASGVAIYLFFTIRS
jgi:hypothetical protein